MRVNEASPDLEYPDDARRDFERAIGRLVLEKMVSGNAIPVERCHISAAEIELVARECRASRCLTCKGPLNTGRVEDEDCGGDCTRCMADAGDPDCLEALRIAEASTPIAELVVRARRIGRVIGGVNARGCIVGWDLGAPQLLENTSVFVAEVDYQEALSRSVNPSSKQRPAS